MECIKKREEAEYKVTECGNKRTSEHSNLAGHFGGGISLSLCSLPSLSFVLSLSFSFSTRTQGHPCSVVIARAMKII